MSVLGNATASIRLPLVAVLQFDAGPGLQVAGPGVGGMIPELFTAAGGLALDVISFLVTLLPACCESSLATSP